jgi:acid phosphatase type 7
MNTSLAASSNQVGGQCRADFSEGGIFWVKPYLQLGPNGSQSGPEVIWFSPLAQKYWSFETRLGAGAWATASFRRDTKLDYYGTHVHRFRAAVPIGIKVEWRLVLNGCPVFSSAVKMPGQSSNAFRAVVFGDFADGNEGASQIADAVMAEHPELLVLAGDLVYEHGRISELRTKFFPVINADEGQPHLGAPLLRNLVMVAVVGNHDVGAPKQSEPGARDTTDLFGYFTFWSNPSNGPRLGKLGVEKMIGGDRKAGMLFAKHGDFVRHSNFSFDWANTHWTMLDGNKYMNWGLPKLRDWLRVDLASSQADFKLVSFHQPGFNSDAEYHSEQRMRAVADILEDGGADVVFSGHCHFYQRFRPIRFRPHSLSPSADGTIDGDMQIDYAYDSTGSNLPQGIIYVISGSGGRLVSTESKERAGKAGPESLLINDRKRSFTRVDVDGRVLTVTQLTSNRQVIDTFTIDKS